jgi:hypothetical protein
MNKNEPIRLKIPRQDLAALTLFRANADAARQWARDLPVTNTRAVAQQLREAISELNRVSLAPEVRHTIMEALRPSLQVALFNLSRRYLNQPLILPEEPRQLAELADTLYSLAATGYTITAVQAIQQKDSIRDINPARLVCEAVHRAIGFESRKILLSLQLYRPVQLHNWLSVHQLYGLADRQQLTRLPVPDQVDEEGTIANVYSQVLLLGCCKPNQLRQSDLAGIYRGLQEWSDLVELSDAQSGSGLFLVDLNADQPPQYSSLYGKSPGDACRLIDTGPLVRHLQHLQEQDDEQGKPGLSFGRDTNLPSNILQHLINALGSMSQRNFTRTPSDAALWIAIGLSNTHFHVAGEKPFEQLLYGDDYVPSPAERLPGNPFLEHGDGGDMWQEANPETDFELEDSTDKPEGLVAAEHEIQVDEKTRALLEDEAVEEAPPRAKYPIYPVQMINASPGGYCLDWSAELPPDILTGDIVSVLEEDNKDWVIAVIRWVSRLEEGNTLVGLELLSPRALPYGACIHRKTGDATDPMRVLLLPEIPLVGQPHTLITPRASFRERQKISLRGNGEEFYIQLQRQIAATGSFAQFDFRYIKHLTDVVTEDKAEPLESSFDSLWSNI